MQECRKGRFLTVFFKQKGREANVTTEGLAFSPGGRRTQTLKRGGRRCAGGGRGAEGKARGMELAGLLWDLPNLHLFTSFREVGSEAKVAITLCSKIRPHMNTVPQNHHDPHV